MKFVNIITEPWQSILYLFYWGEKNRQERILCCACAVTFIFQPHFQSRGQECSCLHQLSIWKRKAGTRKGDCVVGLWSNLVKMREMYWAFFFFFSFFDGPSHSGFIKMRLQNIRRKLQWSWSVRTSSIKNAIGQTFSHQRRWIQVDIEFSRLTDRKEDKFIRKWEVTIIEKLREIASLEKKMDIRHSLKKADSQHNDELCYTMLSILIHLLLCEFCCLRPVGLGAGWYQLDLFAYLMRKRCLKSAQPQLVSSGSSGHRGHYVIVAMNDSLAFPLDVDKLTCAVDRLFKFTS